MTNKNTKQTNLLKKQSKAKKTANSNSSLRSINNLLNSQNTTKVHYRDYNGHKQVRTVTLADPGIGTATQAIDLMRAGNNTSDFADLFQLVMDHVIVSPRLSFAKEEKTLPKDLKSKTVTHKNKTGADVNLHYAWPGYRRAVQIVTKAERPNGAMNMTGALKSLNSYVFKDDDGRSVNNNYWDAGGHASGLGMKAINEAFNYLANVLDHDGFNSVIQKGLSFLTTSLR